MIGLAIRRRMNGDVFGSDNAVLGHVGAPEVSVVPTKDIAELAEKPDERGALRR